MALTSPGIQGSPPAEAGRTTANQLSCHIWQGEPLRTTARCELCDPEPGRPSGVWQVRTTREPPMPNQCQAPAMQPGGNHLAEIWPRFGRDLADIWLRFRRYLAEIGPRFGRYVAEVRPTPGRSQIWGLLRAFGRDLAEIWLRFGRDCDSGPKVIWPRFGRDLAEIWLRRCMTTRRHHLTASCDPSENVGIPYVFEVPWR